MLINETVKIIRASTPSSMKDGGYLVIKNPVNNATNKKNMVTRNDRTLHLWFSVLKSLSLVNITLIRKSL